MSTKKILSLILSLIMLGTCLPSNFAFAQQNSDFPNPTERRLYLHAGENNPKTTANSTTVYKNEPSNVYFSIDNPNMTEFDSSNQPINKEHCLNGYTVKIYYNPKYFAYNGKVDSNGIPVKRAVNVELPDEYYDGENRPSTDIDNIENAKSYLVQKYEFDPNCVTIDGQKYHGVSVTVLFQGFFLPKKTWEGWYDLCEIPLMPIMKGNTTVYTNIYQEQENQIELFAKNKTDIPDEQTFDWAIVNNGAHNIEIIDKGMPAPPTANYESGKYLSAMNVKLSAEKGCTIYYKDSSMSTFAEYPESGIDVKSSTDIECYASRDGIDSVHKTYSYSIVPEPPKLFIKDDDDKMVKIGTSYNKEEDAFKVYPSETDTYAPIEAGNTAIFYTFADEDISPETIGNGDGGNDELTEWVKVDPRNPEILITKSSLLRLVTRKTNSLTDEIEFSDVAPYSLGIRPAEVTANYPTGTYTSEIDVELSCTTTGATIYYTLNGANPITDGIEYMGVPITINSDTTLRAVAKFDGQDGKTLTRFYTFNINDDYGVEAFYPGGIYEESVTVRLTANNPENSIKFRYEGETDFRDYHNEELVITDDTVIYAKAGRENDWDREPTRFGYEIRPLPPDFAPPSTQFSNLNRVIISCPESVDEESAKRYKLYYTTDGRDPLLHGTLADGDSVTIDNISKYTVIKAVIIKDDKTPSRVVTHSYDVATNKPSRPLMTLNPGSYVRKVGDGDGYFTKFMPVVGNVKIYYTTNDKDPVINGDSKIDDGTPIELRGHMVIKAKSVTSLGKSSDTTLFDYTIIPEAPQAPPSSETISSAELPVVPIYVVKDEKNNVVYEINGFKNEFECKDGLEMFWLDLKSGNAYKDKECTEENLLGNKNENAIGKTAELSIKSILDGIESDVMEYRYSCNGNGTMLATPYADKQTGEYEEKADKNGNYLTIALDSLNDGDTIEYCFDNSGAWQEYTSPFGINKASILQIRSKKSINGKLVYSKVKSYVYTFIPLAPTLSLESGRYKKDDVKNITNVFLNANSPKNEKYKIYVRPNGETEDRECANGTPIYIRHTMAVKAYVVNSTTKKKSKNTVNYYIIESENVEGIAELASPYSGVKRMNAELLAEKGYAEGIKLFTVVPDAVIHYSYTYTYLDEKNNEISVSTDELIYKNNPIMVNPNMTGITISTWLTTQSGEEIPDSKKDYSIDFLHLGIPKTTLGETGQYSKNSSYTLKNEHENDSNVYIFYTMGTEPGDPSKKDTEGRLQFTKDTKPFVLTQAVTLKACYLSVCGTCSKCKEDDPFHCLYEVYGTTGTYKYTVPTVQYSGGGGGGGGGNKVVDNTRKYTKDIFGNEHPTHISYIDGYPDGSVKPEGKITREEMTAVLYRITNHKYEKPFVATGDVFPDVDTSRWSAQEIEYMADKKVVDGYPDGEFKPNNNLSRAEFAALICRFAKLNKKDGGNPFSDVTEEHWAYDNITKLNAYGFMDGYEDGTYRPEAHITRAEVMKVVNKLLGRNPSDTYVKTLDFNPYTDLSKDKWYYTDVLEATITHNYYLDTNGVEMKWEDCK